MGATDDDGDGTPVTGQLRPSREPYLVANDQADDDDDGMGTPATRALAGEMVAGETYFFPTYDWPGLGDSSRSSPCGADAVFNQDYEQFGKSWLTFITYQATFRVCYKPGGGGIVSFGSVHGDATYARIPWDWKGNDPGYPYGIKMSPHTVAFRYRGTAAICIFSRGCGPSKHPWVTITFRDNNTMEVSAGVVSNDAGSTGSPGSWEPSSRSSC